MRAFLVMAGAVLTVTACATTPQTTINVDGRDYVASFVENRDPVTNDLIEIRYTVSEFGIECGSRAECEPLIRDAEAARAAAAVQALADEVNVDEASGENVDAPLSALDAQVEVTPLDDAPDTEQE